ncbi:MAG: helix-turn-helix transcriptional regulator [Thermodesulfobacteriota bacterium]|jgi:transcriptional regulator with XRE-family HTH domain
MSKLREVRVVRGVTQFDLRMKTGIHPTKISHFEHGYLEPRKDEKLALARALHVKVEEIFPEDQ